MQDQILSASNTLLKSKTNLSTVLQRICRIQHRKKRHPKINETNEKTQYGYKLTCLQYCRGYLFSPAPFVQNFARNIIEHNINFSLSNLDRHETLPVIIELHFLRIPPGHVAPPCL